MIKYYSEYTVTKGERNLNFPHILGNSEEGIPFEEMRKYLVIYEEAVSYL